jgi:hypothetical protein
MKRTEMLQKIRKIRFDKVYFGWNINVTYSVLKSCIFFEDNGLRTTGNYICWHGVLGMFRTKWRWHENGSVHAMVTADLPTPRSPSQAENLGCRELSPWPIKSLGGGGHRRGGAVRDGLPHWDRRQGNDQWPCWHL